MANCDCGRYIRESNRSRDVEVVCSCCYIYIGEGVIIRKKCMMCQEYFCEGCCGDVFLDKTPNGLLTASERARCKKCQEKYEKRQEVIQEL